MVDGDMQKLDNEKYDEFEKSTSPSTNIEKQDDNGFHNKKFSITETILLVIIALIIGFSFGGIVLTRSNSQELSILKDNYLKEFIKNYNYVLDNYYDTIDKQELIDGAISGMMESLGDPYSVYFDENESDNFSITLDGSYKGIGVQIIKDEKTKYMLITSVFKNSPASISGLKAGDYIVEIDGKDTKDMQANEVSDMIRNSNIKNLKMKLLRGNEYIDVVLDSDTVVLNSVLSKTYEKNSKKIGYIYIGIFASNTYEQFKDELNKLEKEKIDALIIDVRDNTGGHLTSVDGILDLFLNSNQVMYKFSQNNVITETKGTGNDNKTYPIVLLGNENSASASEVLIAGLKENLDCKLIGKKTYGKGTVQKLVDLSDGTKYKITIKKWLTPKGNWINDTKGIEPDIEVELSEKYMTTGLDEDDSQLQEALDYISK